MRLVAKTSYKKSIIPLSTIVQLILIAGAKVNALDESGHTPLNFLMKKV